MAQGLQIFDADGNTTLDTNTSTVKIIAKVQGVINTTFTDPLLLNSTPFYIITPYYKGDDAPINITFNGNTCSVDLQSTHVVYIGVY